MSSIENIEPVKKKRGRKKKSEIEAALKLANSSENIVIEKPPPKKRGRKPKGGKIIENKVKIINDYNEQNSIILHLKCNLKDLENEENNNLDDDVNEKKDNQKKDLIYCDINNNEYNTLYNNTMSNINFSDAENNDHSESDETYDDNNINNESIIVYLCFLV